MHTIIQLDDEPTAHQLRMCGANWLAHCLRESIHKNKPKPIPHRAFHFIQRRTICRQKSGPFVHIITFVYLCTLTSHTSDVCLKGMAIINSGWGVIRKKDNVDYFRISHISSGFFAIYSVTSKLPVKNGGKIWSSAWNKFLSKSLRTASTLQTAIE